MAIEQGNSGEISQEQIESSVNLALQEDLMYSSVLKGPVGEMIVAHCVILLRAVPTGQSELITLVDEDGGFDDGDIDRELASIKVPSHLANGHRPSNDKILFDSASRKLAEKNTPFIMLELGESDQTEQEMIVLTAVKGITVETAITALRNMRQESKESKGHS